MPSLSRRLWKWFAAILAGVLILLAIGVGLFRLAVPMVPGLRADAETIAEQAIGWPVHIGEIDLQWALLGPELVLTDVQMLAPTTSQPLVTVERLDIVFGPTDFFRQGPLRPSHIRLYRPTLALERDAEGELFLSGYALPVSSDTRLDWRQLLDLVLRHGRVTVVEGELHYRDHALDIEDWILRLQDVSLASNGEEHEFQGSFLPPGALGEEVVFRLAAEGEPGLPEQWAWTFDMAVRELKINWWYQQFEWAGPGQMHGALDFALRAAGKGLSGMAGGGELSVADLAFSSATPVMIDSAERGFEKIAMEWDFDFNENGLALDVREMTIAQPGTQAVDGSFALRTGGESWPLEIAAARLPLGVLTELAGFLPDEQHGDETVYPTMAVIREYASRFAPRGDLRELVLGLDLQSETPRYRLETRFDGLAVNLTENLPGFSGLSGSLRASERGGRIQIASTDLLVETGGLFRTPLPVEEFKADVDWERVADGWRIRTDTLSLRNPEASLNAEVILDVPQQGSPLIDMTATVHDADFAARSMWLPVAAMPEKLVEWIDTAVLEGHAPETNMVLRGPLQNFPFRDGSGVFDIRFRAENTSVKYAPGWPRVQDLSADVHFHNASLEINIDHAIAGRGLRVASGVARIADFREQLLDVRADVHGDMTNAWEFLDASPLAEPLDGLLGSVEVQGPMQANVSLSVPLANVDDTRIVVDAGLDGVDVHPTAVPWTVRGLSGSVHVTERQVSAAALKGELTGAPFTARIEGVVPPDGDTFATTHVHMQGRTPTGAFQEFIPPSWLARLSGDIDWKGEMVIPGEGGTMTLAFDSTLEGVSSRLPAPFDNLPPMEVQLAIPDASHVQVQLATESLASGRFVFVENPAGWNFDRGRLVLGPRSDVEIGRESGLFIEGRVPELDARGWLSLDGEAEPDSPALLRGIAVSATRLNLGAVSLPAQEVRASRAGGGWEVRLAGPAQGLLQVPSLGESEQPWRVRLDQLHIPLDEDDGESAAPGSAHVPDPRELPGLDIDIRDLQVGPVKLGRVHGMLQRTAIGYTTQGLSARTGSYEVSLDGRWELIDGSHYTSITATLDSTDVSDTLAELGYRGGVDADDGQVKANLAWHASPMGVERGLLEGTVGFHFRDGSLSEVSPGAGRLLGLLSIAALPRRLVLDFSDFFGEGLHFDTLGGDFLVSGGSAYTTNVVLDGPSVSALLVGRTGLTAQDYDQLAIVTPDVSASLPVAGYIAAGPTVGAALLLLSQLLKAPLSDITEVKYRITGSWEEPVIERVRPQENHAGK